MSTYRIFLLDDDETFLSVFNQRLQQYLLTLPDEFSVHAFSDADELREEVTQYTPDLIIADIMLENANQNGIEVLRDLQINGCTAPIIFITGYLQMATEIFGVQPIFFILKDEFENRIPEAIDVFLKVMKKRQTSLKINVGKRTEVIAVDRILYIERVLRKTVIHCVDSSTVCVTKPLGDIYKYLPEKSFAFTHQSVIVNLVHVKRIGNDTVRISNNDELPVSRSHSVSFRKAMAMYLSK